MTRPDIIRAWKDEEYFSSLSETDRRLMPQNPAGLVELTDQDLRGAEGGEAYTLNCTFSVFGTCISCVTCITVGCIISIPITVLTITPAPRD